MTISNDLPKKSEAERIEERVQAALEAEIEKQRAADAAEAAEIAKHFNQ